MITADDILPLLEIQSKLVNELSNAEILFLLKVFPKLKSNSSICDTTLLRCSLNYDDLKDNIEKKLTIILKEIDNCISEELLQQVKEQNSILNNDAAPITTESPSEDASNLLTRLYEKDYAILCAEFISPIQITPFNIMKEKNFIPIEYIILLGNLPRGILSEYSTINQYIKYKIRLFQSVLQDRTILQKGSLIRMKQEVIEGLHQKYSLDWIAEAYYYQRCTHNLTFKYNLPENYKRSFIDQNHRKNFAERLGTMIKEQELNNSSLSIKADISRQRIIEFLNPGKKITSIENKTLVALARALSCNIDYLFGIVDSHEVTVDSSNTPQIDPMCKVSDNNDYAKAMKENGRICAHTIEKLAKANASASLLPDDFYKIEKYIDLLMKEKNKYKGKQP